MPYRRSDSPVWWVDYTDASGKRVRRSTGTTNQREAKALEAKWKLEVHQMKHWDIPPSHSFEQLMVDYIRARRGEINLSAVGYVTKNLRSFFAGRELEKLKRADISAYIMKRKDDGVKPATINRELDVLSASINYAKKRWDWDIPNPVLGMSLKEPEGRLRWLTRAEADALIRAAESESRTPHLPDFIRLALNTGCRRGELFMLDWGRVDLREGVIRLESQHTKSRKRRMIPLNEEARQALLGRARFRAEYCPASPWVFAHKTGARILELHTAFRTACRRAGIEDFRIHDLRHTFASWLVSAAVPLLEVKELLGHADINMTLRYAHLAPDNLRGAVSVLDRMSRFRHAVTSERGEQVG